MAMNENGHKELNYPVAQEYMGRVRDAERKVEQLEYQKANLRMMLTDTSVHLSDMPRSDSPDLQRHQTIQAKIDTLEQEIAAARQERKKTREETGMMLCRLSRPVTQRIMILYYFHPNRSWKEVANELGYSKAQVLRYRDEGFAELEKLLQTA